jgi:hypothetical protein
MSSGKIDLEDRQKRLSRAISSKTMQGWNVVDRNEAECQAVLMLPGKRVNHVLHFLVTIFTCLIYAIVWIIILVNQKKEKRVRITIDVYGQMTEEPISL